MKVSNGYMERVLTSESTKAILARPLPIKVSYWLAKAMEKMEQEVRVYLQKKQEIIDTYAEKADGETKTTPDGGVVFGLNTEKAISEFAELQKIEVELGIDKIKIDLEKMPDLSVQEISLIMPLLEIVDGD